MNRMALLLMGMLILSACKRQNAPTAPLAHEGVLDLSHWSFEQDGPVELRGEWQFWWQQLVPAENQAGIKPEGVRSVPGVWQGGQGFATYRLDVILPQVKNESLAIWLSDVYSAQDMKIYGAGTHVTVFRQGILGQEREQEIPQYINMVKTIDSSGDRIQIVWHISNFHHARGGPRKTPLLGYEQQLRNSLFGDQITSVALVVLLLSMAIYLFGLVTQRPEDRVSLWFGVTLSITAVWLFLNSRMLQIWFSEPNAAFHEWINTLEYLAFYLVMPALSSFIYSVAPKPWFRRYTQLIWIASAGILLLPLTQPLLVFSNYHLYYKWFDLFAFFIGGTHLIREATQGHHDARLFLLGYSPLVLARIHDVAKAGGLIAGTPFLAPFGVGFFVLIQSHVMARFFAATFRTNERLNRQLQEEVDRQTEKLRLQKDKLELQQAEIVKAHEELKTVDQQKTNFFRGISHELRTPLTLILSSLQSSSGPMQSEGSIDIAVRNAKRLYRLVNQLLDFQKIAMARVQLKTEVLDIEQFLTNIASYVGGTCEARGISFKLQVQSSPAAPWLIQGQIDALEKIIFNYLGNALKFTPRGGTIELSLTSRASFVRMGVRDSGPGIAPSEQGKLFKLFSQVQDPGHASLPGTGLGLALVKELTQQMQGTVGVDSEAGEGSLFWVEFPRLLPDSDRYAICYFDSFAADHGLLHDMLEQHQWIQHCCMLIDPNEVEGFLERYPVQVFICRARAGLNLEELFTKVARIRPTCRRVLILDQNISQNLRHLPAEHIHMSFTLPLNESFIRDLNSSIQIGGIRSHKPVMDVLYIDDEEQLRNQFIKAISRHTLVEHYKVVGRVEDFNQILESHQIKVVVVDENLDSHERGLDLLAKVRGLSPDTYRILFTAERDGDTLAAAISHTNAHYVIYKPADYAKEMRVIEEFVEKSKIQHSELTTTVEAIVERDWHLADLEPEITTEDLQAAAGTREGRKATILIIDDVQDLRTILRNMLEQEGYQVFHATRGDEGLVRAKALSASLDLVITDWMMAGLSGPELIQELHKDEVLASIPTVLLTAKTRDENRSEGLRLGASAYLAKPFDRLELLSVIENLLDLKRRERKIAELNLFISQNVLQRFLPPALVKDLVEGRAIFDDSPKNIPITVLFADLCRFTESSEFLGPKRISSILNTFLVAMTDIIFEEGGTIDKFIGDAILVIFGAPQTMPMEEQSQRALRCARRMQEVLVTLNQQWKKEESHEFKMRIGIHQGPAVVGSFGGKKRSDYTAIGPTVNLAARIEAAAQPGEVLFSDLMLAYLRDDEWELAGSFQLKGIEGETKLYRLRPDLSLQDAV